MQSREGSRADLPELVAHVLDSLVRFLCGESATGRVELDTVSGRVEGWRLHAAAPESAAEASR